MSVNKMFAKYVSQNIMGMIGISLYILAGYVFYIEGTGGRWNHGAEPGPSSVQSDLCHRFYDRRRLCHTF